MHWCYTVDVSTFMILYLTPLKGGGGGAVSHIPLIVLKNIPYPSNKSGKYPQIQKALYPHISKIDPSIQYPFNYLQKYHVSLYFFANIPISLKKPSRASYLILTRIYTANLRPIQFTSDIMVFTLVQYKSPCS